MNIIIPIGGKGERFKNAGYIKSKPLIDIFEKPMIFYIIDNLKITADDHLYIIYDTILDAENFARIVKDKYPFVHLIPLPKSTRGAGETLYLGLHSIMNTIQKVSKNIVIDCDTFYREDILDIYRKSENNNVVFYSVKENEPPIYSYIRLDETKHIVEIKEKNKISNNANTGAYCFENITHLCDFCKYILDNNIVFNNEPYTSCVINEMINSGIHFYGIELQNGSAVSLGTPTDVNEYIQNTRVLLFDLDGTLVDTDDVYVKVWNKLLARYNIKCDKRLFDYFIKGKSDELFIKYIHSSITDVDLSNLSKEKDKLFIECLANEPRLLFPGVFELYNCNAHNKIARVTSSNRAAANHILQVTGLAQFVELVIAAEDCKNHKPDPHPYLIAMDYFNASIDNVFIFEDSYSGYCSALRTGVKNICLFDNANTCTEIRDSTHYKYGDYTKLNIDDIINYYKGHADVYVNDYVKQIYETINTIPVKSIEKNANNLKTGYICDISSYKITYVNGVAENLVLKISNIENELSATAIKLHMYEKETYFYEKISHLIHNTPKFFGSFKHDGRDAILLEDLHKYSGRFNINLNKNTDVLMKVVKTIHDMHSAFYFESADQVMPTMRSLNKIADITYYKELIINRRERFITNTKYILSTNEKSIVSNIYNNIDKIYNEVSTFPLSFCHGDLKSPNIFYKNNTDPILLDWQYIHLNKGVSDIVFMLVESVDFDEMTVNLVINFYYKLQNESHPITYSEFMNDFKNALCVFPFFVCVWFNSEDPDKLLDPVFPIKFMKNLMKYYNHYLIEYIV